MKNSQESTNLPYGNFGQPKSKSSWHIDSLTMSLLFFLCITSSLMMLTVLWNFSLTYQSRALLIEMYLNQTNLTSKEAVLIPNATTTTTLLPDDDEDIPAHPNSTLAHSTSTLSTPSVPIDGGDPVNPIAFLQERSTHAQTYQCKKYCADPSIIIAQLKITLSAEGQNFVILENRVQTTDKKKAKRRVAYEAIRLLHGEYLNTTNFITDPEWNRPISCPTPLDNQEWDQKCRN